MSDEKIDHAALANQAVSIAGMREAIQQGESVSDIAAVAQVHATLALVEQQRIANLIGVLPLLDNRVLIDRFDMDREIATERDDAIAEIRKGLGL